MKKFAILTSVLALAACGGGSHHHGGVAPAELVRPISVEESNSVVTGMIANSEYQVARYVANKLGDDAASVNLSRIATTRGAFVPSQIQTENMEYKVAKELVELAAWLANDTTTKEDIVAMFNTDKNKIKAALKLVDDMYCFVGGNAQTTAERIISRRAEFQVPLADLQQKTEVFDLRKVEFVMSAASGGHGDEGGSKDLLKFDVDEKGTISAVEHIALVKDGTELVKSEEESAVFSRNSDTDSIFNAYQKNGEGIIFTGTGTIVTYGKGIGSGLKYSDFGQLIFDLTETHPDGKVYTGKSYEAFAGGYKELRKDVPETAMNFAGKAVGTVSNHDIDKNITGTATLNFDGVKETLRMNFSNTAVTEDNIPWYDVTIVRNQSNSSDNSITFTTKQGLDNNIPEKLRFTDFENNVRTPEYNLVDGYNGEEYGYDKRPGKGDGKLDIGYYGAKDGNTIEATGVTQYVEGLGSDHNEIRMNVGFGMTKN